MSAIEANVKEIPGVGPDAVFDYVASSFEPLVFRRLADSWPLVGKGRQSMDAASKYLLQFYDGVPVTAFISDADIDGRIFYTENLDATNFRQVKKQLDEVLEQIRVQRIDEARRTVYMGSTPLRRALPGLGRENSLPGGERVSARIWIGNRTTVAAHYDVLENIACVCAGRRRFTLFPPEQMPNLYIGPIDFTPAGQSISLVDLEEPDLDKFPRFAAALESAQTALLEPGDAIFIPAMWWHHVAGLDDFNILINHWWRDAPAYMGAPGDALLHAILNIRDLPPRQRKVWRALFDHYVFEADSRAFEHIPEERRGAVGVLDEDMARRILATLRQKLNR